MQKVIDYVKVPSNFYDYVSLFDSVAKFKPTIPTETQKKEYFKENMVDIMKSYVSYLIKEGKVPAKNQTQFINKLQKNEIQHIDLTIYFSQWLDSDKFFTYSSKKQMPAPQPHPPQPKAYQLTTQTLHHQQTSIAPQTYPKPSTNNQSRTYQSENKREHSNSSSGPIFNITKIEHHRPQQIPTLTTAQKPELHYQIPPNQIHKHVPNAPVHTNQLKKTYGHQNVSHNQLPTLQHYTPHLPDENKPFRQRFFEKLVDYFEYPQRVVNIKQDMTLMFQQKK